MIGDVFKAKTKLGKLLGKDNVKKLVARVEKAQAQNYTVDNVLKQVKQVIGNKGDKLLSKGDDFIDIVHLLSTRPHTTGSSNFVKFVTNAVIDPRGFEQDLNDVYQGKLLRNNFLQNMKRDYLEKYLKREGQEFKNSKHKDVGGKMQSFDEANRLKVIVTALAIVMINRALELNDQNKKNMDAMHNAVQQERQQAEARVQQERQQAEARVQQERQQAEARVQQERQQADEKVKIALAESKVKVILNQLSNGTATAQAFNTLIAYLKRPKTNHAVLDEIEEITIPAGVFMEYSFRRMKKLKKLTVLGEIDGEAFLECPNLETVVFGEGVGRIPMYAFYACPKLKNVTIPKVEYISTAAFAFCESLESVIIKDGVARIGEGAFCNCPKLKTITIPGSVESIGEQAFRDCTGLESVVIKGGVTTIGGAAFMNCSKLQRIEVPKSVTSVGKGAFTGVKKNLIIGRNCKPEIMKVIVAQTNVDES